MKPTQKSNNAPVRTPSWDCLNWSTFLPQLLGTHFLESPTKFVHHFVCKTCSSSQSQLGFSKSWNPNDRSTDASEIWDWPVRCLMNENFIPRAVLSPKTLWSIDVVILVCEPNDDSTPLLFNIDRACLPSYSFVKGQSYPHHATDRFRWPIYITRWILMLDRDDLKEAQISKQQETTEASKIEYAEECMELETRFFETCKEIFNLLNKRRYKWLLWTTRISQVVSNKKLTTWSICWNKAHNWHERNISETVWKWNS